MTDYTSIRDSLTETLENNGEPNGFYVDSAGELNFGYGIDVTVNISNTDNKAIDAIMSALSVDTSLSSATITSIQNTLNSYNASTITAASAASTLNNLISGLSETVLATDNAAAMDSFYANATIPNLQTTLSNYNALTQTAQLALQSISYNSGNGFLGGSASAIRGDIANSDYASAAYQLAFNTATPSDTAYSDRALVSAAEMLGFIPTIDGSHNITSLAATSDANNATITNFLQQVAANNPSTYLATTPVEDFYDSVVDY